MWIGEAWECKPRYFHKYSDILSEIKVKPGFAGFFWV